MGRRKRFGFRLRFGLRFFFGYADIGFFRLGNYGFDFWFFRFFDYGFGFDFFLLGRFDRFGRFGLCLLLFRFGRGSGFGFAASAATKSTNSMSWIVGGKERGFKNISSANNATCIRVTNPNMEKVSRRSFFIGAVY